MSLERWEPQEFYEGRSREDGEEASVVSEVDGSSLGSAHGSRERKGDVKAACDLNPH